MKPLKTKICLSALGALVLFSGCRGWESQEPPVHLNQNMDTQPKLKPYRNNDFFADGRAMRTPPEGTVAQGKLKADDHFYQGKANGELVDAFPATLPLTEGLVNRGQERYNFIVRHATARPVTDKVSFQTSPVSADFYSSTYTARNWGISTT